MFELSAVSKRAMQWALAALLLSCRLAQAAEPDAQALLAASDAVRNPAGPSGPPG